jgi:hypothetical protein
MAGNPWAFEGGEPAAAVPGGAPEPEAEGAVPKEERPYWRATAGGLGTVWWGTALQLTVFVIVFGGMASLIGFAIISDMTGIGLEMLQLALREIFKVVAKEVVVLGILGLAGIVVLGVLLRVIGFARTLAVPSAMGKLYAVIIFLCELAPLGFAVFRYLSMRHAELELDWLFDFFRTLALGGLAPVLGLIFLMIFLTDISSNLGSTEIGPRVLGFIIWSVIGVIVLVAAHFGGMMYVDSVLQQEDITPHKLNVLRGVIIGWLAVMVVVPIFITVKYLGMLATADTEIRRRAVWGT